MSHIWSLDSKLCSLSQICKCKEHPCPSSPDLGLYRTLVVADWVLVAWSWFEFGHWSMTHQCSKFWFSILILRVQRTFMSIKSWFGAFEDTRGSSMGLGILILIWIWSQVFGTPMFRILALSWFWMCKEHPCPLSPDLGLWRALDVPDWGLGSWSWLGYGHWSLIYPCSIF